MALSPHPPVQQPWPPQTSPGPAPSRAARCAPPSPSVLSRPHTQPDTNWITINFHSHTQLATPPSPMNTSSQTWLALLSTTTVRPKLHHHPQAQSCTTCTAINMHSETNINKHINIHSVTNVDKNINMHSGTNSNKHINMHSVTNVNKNINMHSETNLNTSTYTMRQMLTKTTTCTRQMLINTSTYVSKHSNKHS